MYDGEEMQVNYTKSLNIFVAHKALLNGLFFFAVWTSVLANSSNCCLRIRCIKQFSISSIESMAINVLNIVCNAIPK
jgi:hypothetical protein